MLNPYVEVGKPPSTRFSVVALLDVLGFAERMRQSYRDGGAAGLLIDFRSALDSAYENFRNTDLERVIGAEKASKVLDCWHVKAFTDNIVIGFPVHPSEPDAEAEMGSVLLALREYQLEMVIRGFFVRGSVSIGDLYMDDEIVFGDALLTAYEAEQTVARDPRIVISASARSYVKRHFGFYAEPASAPHNEVLLKDADGQLFVNYLGATYDESPESPDWGRLASHKAAVEKELTRFKENPPIWSKYAWVANYHNFICQEQGGNFVKHRIGAELLRAGPERLSTSWALS